MKILITGTAGFIGFHLANTLATRNDEILGIDNINDYYDVNLKYARLSEAGFSDEAINNLKLQDSKNDIQIFTSQKSPNLKFAKIDITDKEKIDQIFKDFKPEVVVNLAAQAGVRYSLINPQAYIDSNITGFLNILEACRHFEVKNLVYASSSSVYGLNENMPFSVHDSVNHPISLYAATKKSNEMMAHTYSHLFGIATTGLRFFTVYGEWGRPDMALFLFTKAALENKSIDVYNHGKMKRDFTYVGDIVKGIVKCIDNKAQPNPHWNAKAPDPANSKAPFKIYNIGNNNPVELMEYIEAIQKHTGKQIDKNMMPLQAGDVPHTFADVSDLISDFDYKPSMSVEEGVGKFVKWYRKFYNV